MVSADYFIVYNLWLLYSALSSSDHFFDVQLCKTTLERSRAVERWTIRTWRKQAESILAFIV
jgi:hypothetical protein